MKILVVAENESVRKMVSAGLRSKHLYNKNSWQIQETTPENAHEYLRNHSPDIIIHDAPPYYTWQEVLDLCQEKGIPLILLDSCFFPEEKKELISQGIKDIIPFPWDIYNLAETINQISPKLSKSHPQ